MMLPNKNQNNYANMKNLADLFAAAVQCGNIAESCNLAQEMASQKLKLSIEIPSEDLEERALEKEFSLRVHIEDRESGACFAELSVKSCDTIGDLKKKMMLYYDFPLQTQRWIVSKKIHDDKEKLHNIGIRGPGHTVFLYIVTARSVGLTLEAYEQQKAALLDGRIIQSSDQPSPSPQSNRRSSENTYFEPSDDSQFQAIDPQFSPPSPFNRQASSNKISHTSSGTSLLQEINEMISSPSPLRENDFLANVEQPANLLLSENSVPLHGNPGAAISSQNDGWECVVCTYINLPTRPGCLMCSAPPPSGYTVPANYVMTPEEIQREADDKLMERLTREVHEEEIARNYAELLQVEDLDLVANKEPFVCPICFDDIEPSQGVVLRECLHTFCRECLCGAVVHSEDAMMVCPFQDDEYVCNAFLQEREIKALVPPAIYQKYLKRGLDQAESQASRSYHCKTANCQGWCFYEDDVNFFLCPICRKENCLTCKAIHENINCRQYQDDLSIRSSNDSAAKQTNEMLKQLVSNGEAMHCPQCHVIVQKKGGCDWIKCSICKTEICWVTKGPRWGPNGNGDTSAGCRCRVVGKCHPDCINCH